MSDDNIQSYENYSLLIHFKSNKNSFNDEINTFLNTMSIELKSASETENKFVKYKTVINSLNHFINFKIAKLFLLKHSELNFNVTDVYYKKNLNLNKRSLTKKESNSFYSSITSFIQSAKKFQQKLSEFSDTDIFMLY